MSDTKLDNSHQVPLDYSKQNGTRAYVAMIKSPAKSKAGNGTYQGMILANPGGPGSSGVQFALDYSSAIRPIIGDSHDLVSFDPRGMWNSRPLANCSVDSQSSRLRKRLYKISGPEYVGEYYEDLLKQVEELADACHSTIGVPDSIGPHMGTVVNVRDMVSVVDAFARSDVAKSVRNATLLNYWGFSYGTILGQTFASMFPDRVGRVVLDGITDPEDYLDGLALQNIQFLDDVIASLFVYCSQAGPDKCPYHTGLSATDIYRRFEASFSQLDAQHAVSQNWTNATTIEQSLEYLKNILESAAYSPIPLFDGVATKLVGLEEALKNQSLASWVPAHYATVAANEELPEWPVGVTCGDGRSPLFNQSMTKLRPELLELQRQSVIAGENWAALPLACSRWRIRAKETYSGESLCAVKAHPLAKLALRPKFFLIGVRVNIYCSGLMRVARAIRWTNREPRSLRQQHSRPHYPHLQVCLTSRPLRGEK